MPELPEVETIARSLEPLVRGRRIEGVELRVAGLRRPFAADFADTLAGRTIEGTGRRGKYLLLRLDDGRSWIWHMGMSGQLLHQAPAEQGALRKHDHVVAGLSDKGRLVFHDPRRFGSSSVERPEDCDLLSRMGPEPLDESAFTGAYLANWRKRSTRMLKEVLMDQRVVAGLGNIYVSEILFLCGLRPTRRMNRVSRSACDEVAAATRVIISEAIEHRGSSVSDFLDGIGKRGAYQWRHRVYAREGSACPQCSTLVKKVVIGQRSSFYCPHCQR